MLSLFILLEKGRRHMNYYAFCITDAEELSRNIMTGSKTFFVKTPLAVLSSDDIYTTMGRLARELQIKNNLVKYGIRYDWSEVLEAWEKGEISIIAPAFFPLRKTDLVMLRDVKQVIVISDEDRLPLRG